MNERVKFIAQYLEGEDGFSELCDLWGVSRKTGYKWVARYEMSGAAGLVDRSRATHSHPHAVAEAVIAVIVGARRRHPRWGPRKLRALLCRQQPTVQWPAASTQWYLSGCLANEVIGLEAVDNDRWVAYFGPIKLGVIDGQRARERGMRQFGQLIRTDGRLTSPRRRPRH